MDRYTQSNSKVILNHKHKIMKLNQEWKPKISKAQESRPGQNHNLDNHKITQLHNHNLNNQEWKSEISKAQESRPPSRHKLSAIR